MMHCNECGFGVNESMRFALMKNLCPSCGSSLFSNRDTNIITLIQNKISAERFSSSFTESQIYDISLFFFNELKGGIGKQILEDISLSAKPARQVIATSEESDYVEEDDIRSEIEKEYAEHLDQLDDDGNVLPEDLSNKAERLRKLHQQRVLTNPNLGKEAPIHSKRGGFKGINRST
jgi:hypothetical protein